MANYVKAKTEKVVRENSGRSKSSQFPEGKRRRVEGKELAPRSARKKGKNWLSECTEKDLKIAKI